MTLLVDTQEDTALSVLQSVFGYQQFRPLQQAIIESVLAGEDNFVLMPTGGGKSLCYQIPALLSSGVAIIVSPLISLMQDQVDSLQANGIAAEFYNSSLSGEDSRRVLARLHNNELKLLYVAPERLIQDSFIERLESIELSLLAVDEAHCVSQWGPDFRPEYSQLIKIRHHFPALPCIALTATADKQTRLDILQQLKLQQAKQHVASFNRANIRYTVMEKQKPQQQLLQFLANHRDESGIIYCSTRKRVESITDKLKVKGVSVAAYHAGLPAVQRQQTQQAFQRDDIQVVVATVAFGMGIDKPNVRFVVHYDMPKHIEGYYQETGRAGRDNLPAEALMFFGLADIATQRSLLLQNMNETQRRIEMHKLNAMVDYAEALTCRRQVLLNYFGESLAVQCGNCDICLNPPETFDATVDAQKALSCVYRLKQRYGANHVVNVLRGLHNAQISGQRHETLSTFGIGAHHSHDTWHALIRQLIHRGLLEQDLSQYSILKLTPKARPVLRGEEQLILAKPRVILTAGKKKTTSVKKPVIYENEDPALFQKLRELRKRLADKADVPPFVIFSDTSLHEMATQKPESKQAFLAINGVGLKKLEYYGNCFLEEITAHLKSD